MHPAEQHDRLGRRRPARSSPQVCVRYENSDIRARTVLPAAPRRCARPTSARGTARCSPARMSRSVTSPRASSSPPTISVDARGQPVGALHLRLDAARLELHLRGDAGAPQLAQQPQRLARGRRRQWPPRTRAAASPSPRPRAARAPAARGRRRIRCPCDRARRALSPARRTGRRRAARSARRASGPESRTSCACSSRGRAPAGATAATGCPTRPDARARAAKCVAHASQR